MWCFLGEKKSNFFLFVFFLFVFDYARSSFLHRLLFVEKQFFFFLFSFYFFLTMPGLLSCIGYSLLWCDMWASCYNGFSYCRPQALDTWDSVVASHGLWNTGSVWDFEGKNTGVGCHFKEQQNITKSFYLFRANMETLNWTDCHFTWAIWIRNWRSSSMLSFMGVVAPF